MVTGDQPATAAAIAKQVNIIPKDMKTIYDLMDETGEDQSTDEKKYALWKKCLPEARAIVVHGDQITKSFEEE